MCIFHINIWFVSFVDDKTSDSGEILSYIDRTNDHYSVNWFPKTGTDDAPNTKSGNKQLCGNNGTDDRRGMDQHRRCNTMTYWRFVNRNMQSRALHDCLNHALCLSKRIMCRVQYSQCFGMNKNGWKTAAHVLFWRIAYCAERVTCDGVCSSMMNAVHRKSPLRPL